MADDNMHSVPQYNDRFYLIYIYKRYSMSRHSGRRYHSFTPPPPSGVFKKKRTLKVRYKRRKKYLKITKSLLLFDKKCSLGTNDANFFLKYYLRQTEKRNEKRG